MNTRFLKNSAAVLLVASVAGGFLLADRITQGHTTTAYGFNPDPEFERALSLAKRAAKGNDWSEARSLLKKHIKSDNPLAMYEYAHLHLKGWGVDRDLERARVLLLQAVQYDFPGRGKAAFELGRVYRLSKGEDCNRIAFEWFSKAVGWGYAKAHAELGKSHARGLGVPLNYDLAIKHYALAVENGSASSVVALFDVALKQQRDGNADGSRGIVFANRYIPLLENEAQGGDAIAARALGRIFDRGLFVDRNTKIAIKWFAIAAANGDALAMHDMALLGLTENDGLIPLDEVVALLKDSASLGYPAAMTALGRLFLKDSKVRDIKNGITFLEKGVKAGHAGAMEELAKLYLRGKFVPRDVAKAKRLAERGALQKHRGAIKVLTKIIQQEEQEVSSKTDISKKG